MRYRDIVRFLKRKRLKPFNLYGVDYDYSEKGDIREVRTYEVTKIIFEKGNTSVSINGFSILRINLKNLYATRGGAERYLRRLLEQDLKNLKTRIKKMNK